MDMTQDAVNDIIHTTKEEYLKHSLTTLRHTAVATSKKKAQPSQGYEASFFTKTRCATRHIPREPISCQEGERRKVMQNQNANTETKDRVC